MMRTIGGTGLEETNVRLNVTQGHWRLGSIGIGRQTNKKN